MSDNKSVKKYVFALCISALLILMFLFSSQDGLESNKLSERVLNFIKCNINISGFHRYYPLSKFDGNLILRKVTHFSEYFVLTILFYKYLFAIKIKKRKCIIIAFVFCLLVASSDEFHQMFVQGRTPLITDVFIDTAGGTFGIITVLSISAISRVYLFFLAHSHHGGIE
jgi:VanZ family protein